MIGTALLALSLAFVPINASATDPLKILPFGDSITAGAGDNLDGYRPDLAQYIAGAGTPAVQVGSIKGQPRPGFNHEGHGGWTSDQLNAIAKNVIEVERPDIVLLHAGTNDIAKGRTVEQAKTSLRNLIGTVLAADPNVFIVVARVVGDSTPAMVEYGNSVAGIVISFNSNRVRDSDMRMVKGDLMSDTLHPNRAGYARMARNWYDSIRWTHPDFRWWPTMNLEGCA